jgi:demethylmenaquinone methyltransferase / 2-methoxy-6-polyprenyl-1,4-benzoquinol methylase
MAREIEDANETSSREGVTAARFDMPAELPTGEAKVAAVRSMFDTIAPRYDLVNRVMTFRLDQRWRRRAVRSLMLPGGALVADLASGTGDLCVELEHHGMRPISIDSSFGMLAADRSGVPRAQADTLVMPFADGTFDGATCGFALRNFVDLGAFLRELGRVVRPGGRIALVDASTPPNPVLRAGHGVYFGKVVPLVGGLISGNRSAYAYLPRSLAYLPPPEEMLALARAAGFGDARRELLSGGIAQLITGTRA